MFDTTEVATQISNWTSLNVKLPKQLTDALDKFELIRWTEAGYQPTLDISTITAENVEDKLRAYAQEIAVGDLNPGALSPLQDAKARAMRISAHAVNNAARAAVPDIIKQLTPEFDKHAKAFVDAATKLPVKSAYFGGREVETLTSDDLVKGGPDAVGTYEKALEAAKYLHRVHTWVAYTSQLLGLVKDLDPVLLILRPESKLHLVKLDAATQANHSDIVRTLDPVLFTAARLGVPFGINTIREAADIRNGLALVAQSLR
ncbi:hypothetical protein [Mycobacteroides abscessus]|uniref:hypothetical protein n=1 Tax=Mycobacteroides abscessus TaxID=36809 RepID=UPI0002585132|nr:hypothetical protein [Mycobacteroides abscessus]EIC67164.1 hypothetical protein OUW_05508 [Mycobacteroides abscessus M93]